MKTTQFLFIYLVLLFTGGTTQTLADSFSALPDAEIQPVQEFDLESTWPSGQAVLFSSPLSGESGFNYRDRLPQTNTEEHHHSLDFLSRKNTSRSTPASFYISICSFIECVQASNKLLFPFHSFL